LSTVVYRWSLVVSLSKDQRRTTKPND